MDEIKSWIIPTTTDIEHIETTCKCFLCREQIKLGDEISKCTIETTNIEISHMELFHKSCYLEDEK